MISPKLNHLRNLGEITLWRNWQKREPLTEPRVLLLLCRKVPSATRQPPADTDSMAAIV